MGDPKASYPASDEHSQHMALVRSSPPMAAPSLQPKQHRHFSATGVSTIVGPQWPSPIATAVRKLGLKPSNACSQTIPMLMALSIRTPSSAPCCSTGTLPIATPTYPRLCVYLGDPSVTLFLYTLESTIPMPRGERHSWLARRHFAIATCGSPSAYQNTLDVSPH